MILLLDVHQAALPRREDDASVHICAVGEKEAHRARLLPSLDPFISGFLIFLGSDLKGSSEIDRGFRVFLQTRAQTEQWSRSSNQSAVPNVCGLSTTEHDCDWQHAESAPRTVRRRRAERGCQLHAKPAKPPINFAQPLKG